MGPDNRYVERAFGEAALAAAIAQMNDNVNKPGIAMKYWDQAKACIDWLNRRPKSVFYGRK